ncbi:hypothetical protein [Phyllobacterium endophyticum]|uniref:hypothetical protein n=1 Tax=Phyllobacterium endophyticum TaxID=1149773 RepID=UPI0011C717DC|nr:hypothetical protein [Phyllobacterium endophyticum]TXR47043.1 hypothetical protein FVA77_21660 [Phyllobacterium endophyticum]
MAYALTQSAGFAPSDGINPDQFDHEIVRGLLAAVASIWQLEDQAAETCVQKAIEMFHAEGAKSHSGTARNVTGGLAPGKSAGEKSCFRQSRSSIFHPRAGGVIGLSLSQFSRASKPRSAFARTPIF